MPDQWGRPTLNDWIGMSQAMNGIQQIGQRYADRAELKANKTQYNKALAGYIATGKATSGVSPDIDTKAEQTYATKLQAEANIAKANENKEYLAKRNGIVNYLQKHPGIPFNKIPKNLYSGATGMKAKADIVNLMANTEQGRTAIFKARAPRIKAAYETFSAAQHAISEYMKKGDLENTLNTIEKVSEELPMPFRIKGWANKENQVLNIEHLDRATGKYVSSGKMSLQEAIHQVSTTGEKQFINTMNLHMETVRQGNHEAYQKPIYAKGLNGRGYRIYSLKKVLDPSQINIEVYDEKTNEHFTLHSFKALHDMGIFEEKPGHEKAALALDKSKVDLQQSQVNLKKSRVALTAAQKKLQNSREKNYVQIDENGSPIPGPNGSYVVQKATPEQVTAFTKTHKNVHFAEESLIKEGNALTKTFSDADKAWLDDNSKKLAMFLKPFSKGRSLSSSISLGIISGMNGGDNDNGGALNLPKDLSNQPAANALVAAQNYFNAHKGQEAKLTGQAREKFNIAKNALSLYKKMRERILNKETSQGVLPQPAGSNVKLSKKHAMNGYGKRKTHAKQSKSPIDLSQFVTGE